VALDPESLAQFLGTIRRFVRERLVPAEETVAESDEVPTAIVDEMRRLGLFGMTIPEAYGGLGPA
jgi:acyl-CoA dehydrogenase